MSNILDEYVGRIFEGLFGANFCSLQTKYEYLNTNSDVRHLIDASEQETLEWLKSRLHKAEGRPFIFNCHNQKIDVFSPYPQTDFKTTRGFVLGNSIGQIAVNCGRA